MSSQIPMAGALTAGGATFAAQFTHFLAAFCDALRCRVFESLDGMWTFARKYLASFESSVIEGSDLCSETKATEVLNGAKFRKFDPHSGIPALAPAIPLPQSGGRL